MVATGGTRYPTHAAAAPEPHVRPVIVRQAEIEVTSHTRAAAGRPTAGLHVAATVSGQRERWCAATTNNSQGNAQCEEIDG